MSIPYEPPTNYKLPEAQEGECYKCRGAIDGENEETFLKDAGFGEDFLVSSSKSFMCRKCFNELREVSKPAGDYRWPPVRRVGKFQSNDGRDIEIFEEDYTSMDGKQRRL